MFKYSFEVFLREQMRYAWLSPLNTPESLKEKYYTDYLQYCKEHNLQPE